MLCYAEKMELNYLFILHIRNCKVIAYKAMLVVILYLQYLASLLLALMVETAVQTTPTIQWHISVLAVKIFLENSVKRIKRYNFVCLCFISFVHMYA